MEQNRRTRRTPVQPPKRKRKLSFSTIVVLVLFLIALSLGTVTVLTLIQEKQVNLTRLYDKSDELFGVEKVRLDNSRADAFAKDLCVASGDVNTNALSLSCKASGSFNLEAKETEYGHNLFEKVYPASITKIMTALVVLENCDLSETVIVGEECKNIEAGSSICMIEPGDQLTVEQLLYGLLLNSGNDAAMSLAVHVGGSVEHFVEMMNEEASALGATGTHFVNPHGLQDENHYTTVYDIYLIFQAALKHEVFQQIIGEAEYYCVFIRDNDKFGIKWQSTNLYHLNEATAPKNVVVVGGKTGTTEDAGNCLCLLAKDKYGDPHISIIMNAESKETLYQEMNNLLSIINN